MLSNDSPTTSASVARLEETTPTRSSARGVIEWYSSPCHPASSQRNLSQKTRSADNFTPSSSRDSNITVSFWSDDGEEDESPFFDETDSFLSSTPRVRSYKKRMRSNRISSLRKKPSEELTTGSAQSLAPDSPVFAPDSFGEARRRCEESLENLREQRQSQKATATNSSNLQGRKRKLGHGEREEGNSACSKKFKDDKEFVEARLLTPSFVRHTGKIKENLNCPKKGSDTPRTHRNKASSFVKHRSHMSFATKTDLALKPSSEGKVRSQSTSPIDERNKSDEEYDSFYDEEIDEAASQFFSQKK